MNLRQVTDAIAAGDRPTMRLAFRSLVSPLGEEAVEASSPGMLVVALNRLCSALADDGAVMPPATCQALGLEIGATYRHGATQAKCHSTRLARQLIATG
jgi:hypothetical protein